MNRKKSSDKESAMVGFNYQPGSERTYSMRNCDHGERWTGSYRKRQLYPWYSFSLHWLFFGGTSEGNHRSDWERAVHRIWCRNNNGGIRQRRFFYFCTEHKKIISHLCSPNKGKHTESCPVSRKETGKKRTLHELNSEKSFPKRKSFCISKKEKFPEI